MNDLNEIKRTVDIVSLAEALGVEVMPNRKQARCFNKDAHNHGDKNPSLSFTTNAKGEGTFKCFACGFSGSIVDLYAGVKGIDDKEAIKELKEMYSTKTPVYKVSQKPPEAVETPEKVKRASATSREIYKTLYSLCGGVSNEAMDYLTGDERGLTEDTIEAFNLFSIPSPASSITKELEKKYTKEQLLEAGIYGDGKNGVYFRFTKYPLIIPYIEDDEIVYLKGRRQDGETPKYMQLANLSMPLFNRDVLSMMKKTEPLYICEGEFDTIIATQEGYKAVGVVGVNGLKKDIIQELKGFSVYLAFDNDDAGRRAVDEKANELVLSGVNVLGQIDLPEGVKDLTEYFIKQKDE